MYFQDRVDAGRQLAELIAPELIAAELIAPVLMDKPAISDDRGVVILGLPRGGVPVAAEVAAQVGAPLDIILVRKLGVPAQPELGFGALGEGGVRVLSTPIMSAAGVTERDVAHVEAKARTELDQRIAIFRSEAPAISLAGRTAVIVDDGFATGSTAIAACRVARARGADRVILAVAVAPSDWITRCGDVADRLIAVATPANFSSVGEWYQDFSPTTDAEVIEILRRARSKEQARERDPLKVHIPWGNSEVVGELLMPDRPRGLVVFAHGSGSSRRSPRNRIVAESLYQAGIASLLIDLLTLDETARHATVDRIDLLAERMVAAVEWVSHQPELSAIKIGVCGASTGAAVALWSAAQPHSPIAAVVSRGGRPDLAREVLHIVTAPTLMIVGSRDHQVLKLNSEARALMNCETELTVVPGATHLFEEPGTLEVAAQAASEWFVRYLAP
jgi:putative phosphoribosyl transferase